MLSWTRSQARAFLHAVHFSPHSIADYFADLGSVQYDPLKPVGRNIDLVFQARVPGYRVDDWEREVYGDARSPGVAGDRGRGGGSDRAGDRHRGGEHAAGGEPRPGGAPAAPPETSPVPASTPRRYYDAWDKQACIVPVTDWPWRRVYHRWHHEHWRRRLMDHYPEAVEMVERALAERGPSTGDDLTDLKLPGAADREARRGSWYGPRLINHVLKALWFTGRAVTAKRIKGRHVYATPECIIPEDLLQAPDPPLRENLKRLILRRHQAVGLLRPNAPADLWSLKLTAAERRELLAELVEEGRLIEIEVAGRRFHATQHHIDRHAGHNMTNASIRFLAPLDALLWDREAVRHLYEFDYVWEVYKPKSQRRFGYYVLPIMYGDRLIGRLDSRLDGTVWRIHDLWWEDGWPETPAVGIGTVAEEFQSALDRFRDYLGAAEVVLPASPPPKSSRVFAKRLGGSIM